jgi:hypothetical protein
MRRPAKPPEYIAQVGRGRLSKAEIHGVLEIMQKKKLV